MTQQQDNAEIMRRLGLANCTECGREIGPEEKRRVGTVTRASLDPETGEIRHGRHRKTAHCTDCARNLEEDTPQEIQG